MPSITVKERQNLFDIAILTSGSMEAVFALMLGNNKSLTQQLIAGAALQTVDVIDEQVVTELAARKAIPATADDERYRLAEGISFWRTELDFQVQ